MASIRKHVANDGTITFLVRVRLKGQKPRTATFHRLTDAKRWAETAQASIRERRYFPTNEATRRTLADLLDRYSKEYADTEQGKREGRPAHVRTWRELLGHVTLADLTPSTIAEARDKLAATEFREGRRYSPAGLNRKLSELSRALSIATREWEWIPDNPMRRVRKAKEPPGRARFLSDDEREAFLAACQADVNPHLYPVALLALSTGARHGELRSLTWDKVDLKRGWITLEHTKNGDRRGLPLTGPALEAIRAMSKVRRIDSPLVFPGGGDAKVWLYDAIKRAAKVAELENFRFHDLRHSAASYLLMNGASLGEIADILGHRTLAMVKRYSHIADEHRAKVVTRMNEAVFAKKA